MQTPRCSGRECVQPVATGLSMTAYAWPAESTWLPIVPETSLTLCRPTILRSQCPQPCGPSMFANWLFEENLGKREALWVLWAPKCAPKEKSQAADCSNSLTSLAPRAGFEPATNRLTAG